MSRKTNVGLWALVVGGLLAAIAWLVAADRDDETAAEKTKGSSLIAEVKPAKAAKAAKAKPVKPKKSGEPPESEQDEVFEVNGRKFRSLQEAVDAAKDGDTITLTGDAYVRNPVAVRKSLNFNLNGYRLVAKNSALGTKRARRFSDFLSGTHAIAVYGDHQVTVENGSIDVQSNGGKGGFTGAVEVVADPTEVAVAEPPNDDWKFDTVLRDLDVTTDASRDAAFRNAEGKMLIDGCTVRSTGGNGSYTVGAGNETTIRDCDFQTTGTAGNAEWWNNTIAVAFDGKTTVESGTYVAEMAEGAEGKTYGTYVYSSGGTIEVLDGEFKADNVVQVSKDMATWGKDYGASEVVVKDGALSGKMETQVSGEDAKDVAGVSAYGGFYDNAPTAEQVPEGQKVVDYGDGTYSVEKAAQK